MASQMAHMSGSLSSRWMNRVCSLTLHSSGSSLACGAGTSTLTSRPIKSQSPSPKSARLGLQVRAVAEIEAPTPKSEVSVLIDNAQDSNFTVVTIAGYNRPGLLTSISGTFRDLGLDVGKVGDAL